MVDSKRGENLDPHKLLKSLKRRLSSSASSGIDGTDRIKMAEAARSSQTNANRGGAWQQVKGYSAFLILSIIWGLAFVAIRRADFELSPVDLALLRWFVASAGFLAIVPFMLKPKTRLERRDLPRLLALSALNVPIYHLSLNFAETTVSAGLAGFLISLSPVVVAVLSTFLLKEKIGRRLMLALLVGIVGALVLSIPSLDLGSGSIIGPLEVIVAMLAYATFSVLSKPLVHKYGPATVTIWAGLIGTVMLLPLLSSGFGVAVAALSVEGWVSVLFLSFFSTVIGYTMFYVLVGRGAVSKLSIQLYLIPVVSVVGGIVLLQEGLNAYTIAGGAILLLSVGLATKSKS
ncbi:MAG: DMT family transporter [Candidatus Bathyarchaeia archaeon]